MSTLNEDRDSVRRQIATKPTEDLIWLALRMGGCAIQDLIFEELQTRDNFLPIGTCKHLVPSGGHCGACETEPSGNRTV
jgi:hypothetical protein